ncbi:MAG: hypothetical protein M1834_004436 [Cirrosporium novae-zelandiae]|nr:MAG: hypothetical protein M1834_004436 [Cirrosporium novae-zelandiae]
MSSEPPHPLLPQIPLTVSPFISLPTAPTLPYTYKPTPTTLPPSSTSTTTASTATTTSGPSQQQPQPQFIHPPTSSHAFSPEEIIASCRALQTHLKTMQEDAERALREWEDGIRERELAEKRRLAPGWLDREEKILEPVRVGGGGSGSGFGGDAGSGGGGEMMMEVDGNASGNASGSGGMENLQSKEGEELDRAFGGLRV